MISSKIEVSLQYYKLIITIPELSNSITFLSFKTSLVIAPPPSPSIDYKNLYVSHLLDDNTYVIFVHPWS